MANDDNSPTPASADPQTKDTGQSQNWLQILRRRLGLSSGDNARTAIEDALKAGDGEAAFSDTERDMLQRTLRFGALRVDDVMVPRADIIAIDETESVRKLLETFDDAGVSRIPLFRETLDDPRGMIHVKDLMRWLMGDALGRPVTEGRPLPSKPKPEAAVVRSVVDLSKADLDKSIVSTKLRRPVLYVPPSMPATNLLIRMRTTRIHMALVVDEYGGTDGLVTIEDLVEQIVGDIEDEHDEAEVALITRDDKGDFIAAARTPVSDLEEQIGIKLLTEEQTSEIDTLGGLVFALVGYVPSRGELVKHQSGLEFEVLDADARRVKRLKVHTGGLREAPTSQAVSQQSE
ncbi:MAG TPA: hemolysin family protein [Hyphomicrobiaceae bacterium]|nr:hemolysin family protein [Hyphomicrobiaceae bacterium]